MKIELKNYNIKVKEKITWKELINYEEIVNKSLESWWIILFFIDDIIEYIEKDDKKIKNKEQIEEIIFSIEDTERNDLIKIVNEIIDYLNKKKS